jgi:hypothetical protein
MKISWKNRGFPLDLAAADVERVPYAGRGFRPALTKRRTRTMTERFFCDLITRGTKAGSDATEQDFQDALRMLRDQATRYYQLDDVVGEALCRLAIVQLLAARLRRSPVVPY